MKIKICPISVEFNNDDVVVVVKNDGTIPNRFIDDDEEEEVLEVSFYYANAKYLLCVVNVLISDNMQYINLICYDIKKVERERIGKRVALLRKERNLTQEQLAEMCGLVRSHISHIEAGKYNVRLDTLAIIAKVFNCSIDFLRNS